jgi:hypothetical protein
MTLRAGVGWTLSGRVVDERGRTPPIAARQVRLMGQTLTGVTGPRPAPTRAANADWTFAIAGIFGPARVGLALPEGWAVRSIRRAGRDIGDAPLEGGSGEEVSDVEIVLTDRVTTISGIVQDRQGTPATGGTVIVFADDAERWFEGSRWVQTARPDDQGFYRVVGLPPGVYLAVALEYVEDDAWTDPGFLESLRPQAKRLTLSDAAAQTVPLRLQAP